MWRWGFLIALVQGCIAGPADECPAVGARCDGNTAVTCASRGIDEFRGHLVLTRKDCGARFCQAPSVEGAEAFCALDAAVDPAAPTALQQRHEAHRCVGGSLVTLRHGFRVNVEPCAGGEICIDESTEGRAASCEVDAFCGLPGGPDAQCVPGRASGCRDEQTLFYCTCGFRRDEHACQSPGPRCVFIELKDTPSQGVCRH